MSAESKVVRKCGGNMCGKQVSNVIALWASIDRRGQMPSDIIRECGKYGKHSASDKPTAP